jgi:hypothetical protein
MMKTATAKKQKPAPTLEERLSVLHGEIDALVADHVDKITRQSPGVPRSVIEHITIRGVCKCEALKLVRKADAV